MEITIRQYRAGDAPALTGIFQLAVESLSGDFYSEREIRAWAPLPVDTAAWQARLDRQRPWVATHRQQPVGFISLLPGGLIGLAFVHPDYQRQGVAGRLYARLEREALNSGLERLHVEASHAARPLFERLGFTVVKRNLKHRNGCTLINWSMEKSLRGRNRPTIDTKGRTVDTRGTTT